MSEPPETIQSDAGAAAASDSDGDEAYCAACGQSYPIDANNCPKDGSRLTKLKARPDPLLGRMFDGRYEVRSTLGQGGMGTVYRGWQMSVDREVAIKVIHPKLASDRIAVKRFLREVRLASRISQPGIVNVYDSGQTEDGILYLVMELLRGRPLAQDLLARQPIAMQRVETIALQLCDALDVAHAAGIVHRDLKPGNIVILDDPPGRDLIKVLDFGLAKSLVADTSSVVTQSNAIIGTPLYMAPEQIQNRPADERADLYSLGCIIYQLVSGRPPFIADSVNQVLAMHIEEAPDPLPGFVPPRLQRVILKLLAKDPGNRILSAALTRTALEDAFVEVSHASTSERTLLPAISPQAALAVTAPATPTGGAAAVSAPVNPAIAPHKRKWGRLIPAVIILGLAIVYLLDRNRPTRETPAATPVLDAQSAPAAADAAPAPVVDAPAPVVDAAPAQPSPADAGKPKRPPAPPPQPKRDAGVTTPPPPPPPPPPAPKDAGLEFLGLDAAP